MPLALATATGDRRRRTGPEAQAAVVVAATVPAAAVSRNLRRESLVMTSIYRLDPDAGMTKAMTQQPYVLGTGGDELERLSLQHSLWADTAHAAWRRAGIAIGQRVLDVGCGPGYAAFDLAQLVQRSGRVVAVDESEPFLKHVEQQAASRQLPHLSAHRGDAEALPALVGGEGPFDLAYARWVLCFVSDPERAVEGVAQLLKPGGRFVVHDYFNYASMTLAPRSPHHDRAVAATKLAWHERGGDPDVVERLPGMIDRAGLEVVHLACHQRTARAGESMFAWVDTWWHSFAPKLVDMGLLAATDCEALLAELASMRNDPQRFIHCPPVYEIIATKR